MDHPLTGDEWLSAEREAFDRTGGGFRLADAIAGLVATTGPILWGLLVDRPHVGLIVGLGGLNVAMSMGAGRPLARARWGLPTMVVGAALIGLATLVHPVIWLSVLASFVVVGLASTARLLGRAGNLVGFVVSAAFVVGNGLEGSAADAPARAAQFLVGGAVAVALMMLSGLADPVPDATAPSPAVRAPTPVALAAVRSHGVTVGVVIALSTLLYRAFGLDFGYWIPLTELAVLQPDAHASRVRLLQRASGTVIGCLVVLVSVAISASGPVLVAMIAVASFLLFALRERSYHWFVTLLTPTALLMISTLGVDGRTMVVDRLAFTSVGLAVAILVVGVTARLGAPPTR